MRFGLRTPVMNLKERDPRRSGNAGLGAVWTDFLAGEALELLFGLPHVRNPDSIVGFGDRVSRRRESVMLCERWR